MARIAILGAGGRIARLVTERLLAQTDADLTLFLRRPDRLGPVDADRVTVAAGDVLDTVALAAAIDGADAVFSGVGGTDLDAQTDSILDAMGRTGVRRLVFISMIGVHDEVPGAFGAWNASMIAPYLAAAKPSAAAIEASGLDYTILRPTWLTDEDEPDYETTGRDEPVRGTEVSRASVADLAVRLLTEPDLMARQSIGVVKPGTEGDKPAWY
ncbi:NAD(P)H-binding protein [Glycomyces sp. NPDC047369]